MRIAFFGSSLVSAYWNGAATYYRGILKALAGRGHRITFYEPDALGRQEHRDIPDPDWARVEVYEAEGEDGVRHALAAAREADLVIKASGVGVHDALLEEAVLDLRSPGRRVAYWDVDAPATLDRLDRHPDDPLKRWIPEYDLVFTYGGGPPVVEGFLRHGARACVPVYNALDPDTHHPAEPEPRFDADLALLANRLPDREERIGRFFFKAASLLPWRRFVLGGSGWDPHDLPGNVQALGHVYTRDHNAFNSSPKAVLNVNRESMARCGYSPATRIFEAAGAGACLISDRWEGIELFLEPGREVLLAEDGDEVAETLSGLDPATARQIGRAARERVLDEHTYADRAARVEATLNGSAGDAREVGP